MLHSLKRAAVGHKAKKTEPENAEFENVKQRLDNVYKALDKTVADIDLAEKTWSKVVDGAAHFSESLHSLYPIDDDMRALFKTTSDQVGVGLKNDLAVTLDPASSVRGIERMVKAYLMEIKTLQGEYKKVDVARTDYGLYQDKVDKLEKKNSESDKQNRNLDKMEGARATYTSILDGMVHRMNSTYAKSSTMFRAAFVAYWLWQSRMNRIVGEHFQPAIAYATANEHTLFQMTGTAAHTGGGAGASASAAPAPSAPSAPTAPSAPAAPSAPPM